MSSVMLNMSAGPNEASYWRVTELFMARASGTVSYLAKECKYSYILAHRRERLTYQCPGKT